MIASTTCFDTRLGRERFPIYGVDVTGLWRKTVQGTCASFRYGVVGSRVRYTLNIRPVGDPTRGCSGIQRADPADGDPAGLSHIQIPEGNSAALLADRAAA